MSKPAPGLYPNMPREDYDKIEAMNGSALFRGTATLEHIAADLQRQRAGQDDQDSKAKKLGRAVHTAILQPDKFGDEWEVLPKIKATTKPGCITEIEHAQLQGMVGSLKRELPGEWETDQPTPYDLLFAPGQRELCIVWEDAPTGLLCKGLIDSLPDHGEWVGDLKTARDASPRAFERAIWGYKYYAQAAFYHAGLAANEIVRRGVALVAIEKSRPYPWGIYLIEGEYLDAGYALARELLDGYAECLRAARRGTGIWPSYGSYRVEVPEWAEVKGGAIAAAEESRKIASVVDDLEL